MKRKKSPVALITVLVMAIVGLVIASGSFSFYQKSPEEQMQVLREKAEAEMKAKAAEESPKKIDGDSEGKQMLDRLKSSKINKSQESDPEGVNKPPSIIMQDMPVYVPKPNEAATSSQWYDQKK